MKQSKSRKRVLIWEWMEESFPLAFNKIDPRPLASCVLGQLQKCRPRWMNQAELEDAYAAWCARGKYLRAVAAGGRRYGLNGWGIEPVRDEEAQAAADGYFRRFNAVPDRQCRPPSCHPSARPDRRAGGQTGGIPY